MHFELDVKKLNQDTTHWYLKKRKNINEQIKKKFLVNLIKKKSNHPYLKKIELYEDENKHYKKPALLSSLEGVSISDLMIIDKWLYYASIIGDKSFKDLKLEITESKYIDYKMTNQKLSRINQFQE